VYPVRFDRFHQSYRFLPELERVLRPLCSIHLFPFADFQLWDTFCGGKVIIDATSNCGHVAPTRVALVALLIVPLAGRITTSTIIELFIAPL
jgi:hypothetical protein